MCLVGLLFLPGPRPVFLNWCVATHKCDMEFFKVYLQVLRYTVLDINKKAFSIILVLI